MTCYTFNNLGCVFILSYLSKAATIIYKELGIDLSASLRFPFFGLLVLFVVNSC